MPPTQPTATTSQSTPAAAAAAAAAAAYDAEYDYHRHRTGRPVVATPVHDDDDDDYASFDPENECDAAQNVVNNAGLQRYGISHHRVPTAPSSSGSGVRLHAHDAWPVGTRSSCNLDDDDEEEVVSPAGQDIAPFYAVQQQQRMTVVGLVSNSAILHSVAAPEDVVVMVEEQQPDRRGRRRASPQQQQLDQGSRADADLMFDARSRSSSRSPSQPRAQTPPRQEQQRSRQPEYHHHQQQHDHSSSSSLHQSFGRLSMTSYNMDNRNTNSTVDSAVRRAQETMLSFKRDDAAAVHLKPEEHAPPRPVRPREEEVVLKLKTSRRCLERVRQEAMDVRTNSQLPSYSMTRRHGPAEPHRNVNMTFVLGLPRRMYREQEDLVATAPTRFMAVRCDVCEDELIVPKSAVMVECPRCHNIGAAAAIPCHNHRYKDHGNTLHADQPQQQLEI